VDLSDFFISLIVGVGLAAAAGFRLFIPLLVAAIAIRFGYSIPYLDSLLPTDLHLGNWLGTTPAIVGLSVAAVVEVLAYKIPLVDHFLDLLTTPAAIAVGSLLVAIFLQGVDNPLLKFTTAILFGGGAAGLVQLSTAGLRAVSTKTTGGLGNPLVSVIEAISSFVMALLAIVAPLICLLVLGLIIWGLYKIFLKLKSKPSPDTNHSF